MENIKNIYLESEVFEDTRDKFNMVLQRLFKNMSDTNASDGSITLKIDVNMRHETIANNDPDIQGDTRKITLPNFDYKVSSTISVKEEEKGNNNPQMELVWDEDKQIYVLQPVANTTQRSIFDKDFQYNMNSGNSEDNQNGIETSTERDYLKVAQIEGPVDGDSEGSNAEGTEDAENQDIIDGEYREVGEDTVSDDAGEDQGDDPEADGTEEEETEETAADAESYEDGEEYPDEDQDDGYGYEEPTDYEE